MASEIGKKIDAITSGPLAVRLKEHGYRKKGRTFYRRGADGTCIVSIQASRSKFGSSGSFTMNLGVYFPDIEEPLRGSAPRDPPAEYDCTLRQRIGSLTATKSGHWWTVSETADLDAISRDIAEAWRVYGRPWLDTNATLAGASPTLAQRNGLHGAVVSMLLGDRREAERRLQEFLNECPPLATGLRATAERWARAVGIL